jgi:hypothetical protein
LLRYNVIAADRNGTPVHSGIILLRREANASDITGHRQHTGADGHVYLDFRYTVVRLWDEPLTPLLEGGLGTLPLAALTDQAVNQLPGVIVRFEERLRELKAPADAANELRGIAFVLMGLRYDKEYVQRLYQGVLGMQESSTYQWILEQGAARGAARAFHESILIVGEGRFGPAPAEVRDAVNAITDSDRLRRITRRLQQAADWNDLLATA